MVLNQVLVSALSLASVGGLTFSSSALGVMSYATASDAEPLILAQEEGQFEFEDFQFWADQCLLMSQESDHQKTLETCEQAISLRPKKPNLELWRSRSQALFNLGMDIEAIASFNQVLAEAPQDSVSLTYQCAAFGRLSRYDEAVDTCEAALRTDGNWGDRSPGFAWYHRGLALQEKGRLETALDSFARAAENQPENALYQASKCAVEIELGRAFPLSNPRDSEPTGSELPDFESLDSNVQRCKLATAIALYDQALTEDPENANLWLQQGLALEQVGDYSGAAVSYEQALAIRPDHSFTLAHQCATVNQLGDYETGLAACEAALQGDNQWGRVGLAYGWSQHSRSLIGMEDYEGALASARRATESSTLVVSDSEVSDSGVADLGMSSSSPDQFAREVYPPALNNLAVSYWHLGHPDRANRIIDMAIERYQAYEQRLEESFERSYPEAPVFFYRGYILAHYNRGRILASIDDPAGAREAYETAILLHSNIRTSLRSQVVSVAELDRTDSKDPLESVLYTDWAVIDSTLQSLMYTHRAIAHLQINDIPRSLQDAKKAVALDPNSFVAQYNQGLVSLTVGGQYGGGETAYGEALTAYVEANRLQPENVYVLTGQGLALTGLNRTKDALTVLEQVLNILPRYAPAENAHSCIMNVIRADARANPEAAAAGNDNADRLAQVDIRSCAFSE